MNANMLDIYFNKWCDRQSPDRVFEWGAGPTADGRLEAVKKRYDEMSLEEKRTMWELKVWSVVAAIQ